MYEKQQKGWTKHWDFIILDILSVELAICLAYFSRFGSFANFDSKPNQNLLIIAPFIDFVILLLFGRFSAVLRRNTWPEFTSTVKHTFLLTVTFSLLFFLAKVGGTFSRVFIALFIIYYFILSFMTRIALKKTIQKNKDKLPKRSIIIVASINKIEELISSIESNNYQGYVIKALVPGKYESDAAFGFPCLNGFEGLISYCLGNWVDEVLFELNPGESIDIDTVTRLESMGITIHIASPLSTQYGYKVISEQIAKIPVLTVSSNVMSAKQAVEKRILDICGGLVGSFITLILIVIIGPIIKIKSPGPIFFKQTRVGKNGKPFKIIKFRSMYMDAEDRKKELMAQNRVKDGMMFKMEFDPRVIGNYVDAQGNKHTGIGEFIRKYSLDEFPQFFNVLLGDMSLVGTRPPTMDEYVKYQEHHKARLAAKPGITGMWQVSGRSEITDFEEVVKLDASYINNWNLGEDIKILLKTVKMVIKREGAM